MKRIALTKGQFAIVDDEDFEFLSQFKWQYTESSEGQGGYAIRTQVYPKRKTIRMHREVLGLDTKDQVDHVNLNKLDNRKRNLRIANAFGNACNKSLRSDNTSGVKGVSFFKSVNRWGAYIYKNNKQIYLGSFASKDEARKRRLKELPKYHGEFARA